jgi:uncharacterized protein
MEAFCQRWGVSEVRLFGSVLRHDFRADSDVDVLLSFGPDVRHGLLARERMRADLSRLFGRRIDLVNRASLDVSRDARRRREIVQSARVVHVAGR